ncbi:unnamed protein product [Sphagnum troendelagicum]|uniref:Uncharacterized protein n=1 Tax=Sphagnum troendelagicum TaxID=128251 RepID=A0ABP0UK90_9BRYO
MIFVQNAGFYCDLEGFLDEILSSYTPHGLVATGIIVLEALILTAAVVVSLTAYTFWAASKGYDFSYLGPILFVGVIILILFGIIQTFFPLGPISMTIYGVLSSLIFSAYIIYDTDNLIKRYAYDEFIWASVALYLDVINLFLSLLEILRSIQSDN